VQKHLSGCSFISLGSEIEIKENKKKLEKFIFPIRNATFDLVLSYFAASGSNVNHGRL
jgi:hypothetical protein